MSNTINVPTREEVTTENQVIFDSLTSQLGFVPNLFATYAHSKNALSSYLALNSSKSSLRAKDKEAVNKRWNFLSNTYCKPCSKRS